MTTWAAELSALLPMKMLANMKTVEQQFEDISFDMIPYKDSAGHTYDFGFEMNWSDQMNNTKVMLYK